MTDNLITLYNNALPSALIPPPPNLAQSSTPVTFMRPHGATLFSKYCTALVCKGLKFNEQTIEYYYARNWPIQFAANRCHRSTGSSCVCQLVSKRGMYHYLGSSEEVRSMVRHQWQGPFEQNNVDKAFRVGMRSFVDTNVVGIEIPISPGALWVNQLFSMK